MQFLINRRLHKFHILLYYPLVSTIQSARIWNNYSAKIFATFCNIYNNLNFPHLGSPEEPCFEKSLLSGIDSCLLDWVIHHHLRTVVNPWNRQTITVIKKSKNDVSFNVRHLLKNICSTIFSTDCTCSFTYTSNIWKKNLLCIHTVDLKQRNNFI